MSSGAREREKNHPFFYRDNYRKATRLLPWVLILMMIQTGIIGYQLVTRKPDRFYATQSNGNVVLMRALSRGQALAATQAQQSVLGSHRQAQRPQQPTQQSAHGQTTQRKP